MAGAFDSSNLMYVTKAYEEEVKGKAKTIYADDEVSQTVENINPQLDIIIKEIDSKMGFVVNKVSGPDGVDAYVEGVHTQIDRVDISSDDMVPDAIVNTGSHPSILAFKEDRSKTKYNSYDFITKKIELNNESVNLALNGSVDIDPTEQMLTFNVNTTNEEWLKIIEFSVTYNQHVDVMSKGNEIFWKDRTPMVSRVLSGKFFLIRHDPVNAPTEFIIKAIVQNSDNTGNIIDKKIVDVKEYKTTGNLTYIFDDGPQFDLYFNFIDNSSTGLQIHLGKIVPYRYVARNKYITVDGDVTNSQFARIERFAGGSNLITSTDVDDVFYSTNLQCSFIIDNTKNRISIVNTGDKFENNVLSTAQDFNHVDGTAIQKFWVKDIGFYTFIRIKDDNQDTCYVGMNSVTNLQNLGRAIDDIIELSTGEVVVKLNHIYYYYDMNTHTITTDSVITLTIDSPDFVVDTQLVEHDEKYLIQFYTRENAIAYRMLQKDSQTGMYRNVTAISTEHILENFPQRILDIAPTSSKLILMESYRGITICGKYDSDTGHAEVIYNVDGMVISGISYLFNDQTVLELYDIPSRTSTPFDERVEKIIDTNLFTFLITEDKQLYIIDERRIVKAVTFTEESGKGWTDKNSVLYMLPKVGEDEYYLGDNAYLQDVLDVIETPNGIHIIDEKGVYLLNANKNLDCKVYVDGQNGKVVKYLPKFDKYGTSAGLITVEDTTATPKYYNVFKQDFKIKEISNDRLRYDYLDLFTSDYQLYTGDDSEYVDDVPIIDFKAELFITLIDMLSPLYNTVETNNIHTDTITPYGDVFTNEDNKLYVLSPNKYGFIKYVDLMNVDSGKLKVSDINAVQRLKFIHNSNDSFTYQDCIDLIHKFVKDEYERYYKDTTEVARTFNYVGDEESDELQRHIIGKTGVFGANTYRGFVDTKYGVYAIDTKDNKLKNFPKSSLTKFTMTNPRVNSSDTYNYTTKYNGNPNYLKIISVTDEMGTTFMSLGDKVLKAVAWKDNEFKIPFTDNSRISQVQLPIDDANNEPATIVRIGTDNTVSATSTTLNGSTQRNIYEYNLGTDTWSSRNAIMDLLKDEPDRATSTIVDFVKIDKDYHIIYKTPSEKKYIIRGNRSLQPSYVEIFGDATTSGNTNFWIFDDIILCKSGNALAKYDHAKEQFVKCVEIGNIDVILTAHEHMVYGAVISQNHYIEDFFKINTTENTIETLMGKPNTAANETPIYIGCQDGVLRIVSSEANKTVGYYIGNDKKYLIKEDIPGLLGLSAPEAHSVEVYGKEYNSYTQYSVRKFGDEYHAAAVETNDGTEAMYRIGHNGRLSSTIMRYYKTTDTEPSQNPAQPAPPDAGPDYVAPDPGMKTYYKFNPGESKLFRYPKLLQKIIYNQNAHEPLYVFKRTVLKNNEYVKINKDVVTTPIKDIDYYRLELNGNYTLQHNLEEFDERADYYIEDATYEIVSNVDGITYEPTAQYFACFSPAFTACEDADYDETTVAGATAKAFKPNRLYFESTNDKVVISLKDNGIHCELDEFIKISSGVDTTKSDLYDRVDTSIYTTPDSSKTYYTKTESGYSQATFTDPATFTDGVQYFTKTTEYPSRIGDRPINIHTYYNFDTNDLYIDQPDRHNIHTHVGLDVLNPSEGSKIHIDLDIGKIRIVRFDTNTLLLCLVSHDYQSILEEYLVVPTADISKFTAYKTTQGVFITKATVNDYDTYVVNLTTGKMVPSNTSSQRAIQDIYEMEDGKIYGFIYNDAKLSAYLYGETGTTAFAGTPTLQFDDNFKIAKTVRRVASDGKYEVLIFGAGDKYNLYKLYDNQLLPVTSGTLFTVSMEKPVPLGLVDNDRLIINDSTIYDFSTDSINIIYASGISKNNVHLIADTSTIENFVNDYHPNSIATRIYDPVLHAVYSFTGSSEDGKNSMFDIGYESDYAVHIHGANTLPVVDKNGVVYYTMCKANNDTLLPDYSTRYVGYDSDGFTVIAPELNFDRLFMTSEGIFGVRGTQLYLNKIYNDNNGFVLLKSFIKPSAPNIVINVQETRHGIFVTYKDIYRYDSDTSELVDALNFGEKRVSYSIANAIDRLTSSDAWWTKVFVSERHDEIFYLATVDNNHDVYRYNTTTKSFDLWETLGFEPKFINEIRYGVIVVAASNLRNISTKTDMTLTTSDGTAFTADISRIFELSSNDVTIIGCVLNDASLFGYDESAKTWVSGGVGSYGTTVEEHYENDYRFQITADERNNIVTINDIRLNDNSLTPFGSSPQAATSYVEGIAQGISRDENNIGVIKNITSSMKYSINDISTDGENSTKDEELVQFKLPFYLADTGKYMYGMKLYGVYYLLVNNRLYISISKDDNTLVRSMKKEYDPIPESELKPRHVGYKYTLFAENKNIWNNSFKDNSNSLEDKFLMTVVGLATDTIVERFYDKNSYFSDKNLNPAVTADNEDVSIANLRSLKKFYKNFYATHWSKNKRNHIFPMREDVMNTVNGYSENPLKDPSIFDDQKFEIELEIFTAPVIAEEKDTIDTIRVDEPFNAVGYHRRDPSTPYYPFR